MRLRSFAVPVATATNRQRARGSRAVVPRKTPPETRATRRVRGAAHRRRAAPRRGQPLVRAYVTRTAFAGRLDCRATTRKGTPCRRMPLPRNGYCPSHQHLAETEEVLAAA